MGMEEKEDFDSAVYVTWGDTDSVVENLQMAKQLWFR